MTEPDERPPLTEEDRNHVIEIISDALFKSLQPRHRVSAKNCKLAAIDVFEALDAALSGE